MQDEWQKKPPLVYPFYYPFYANIFGNPQKPQKHTKSLRRCLPDMNIFVHLQDIACTLFGNYTFTVLPSNFPIQKHK